jgi:hypothetical protein
MMEIEFLASATDLAGRREADVNINPPGVAGR